MPKELLYIAGFPKGSYGNASANDIPEGYAVYTENTDPRFSDRLAPTRKSSAVSGAADLDAEVLRATNFDGVAVWGWKASNRALRAYSVSAGTLNSALTTPSGNTLASISNINRQLYLPLYDDTTKAASDAYWAGLIAHGQFNTAAAPTTYVLEKAKCDPYFLNYSTKFQYAACFFNYDSGTPANSEVSNSTTSDVFGVITPPAAGDFNDADADAFFSSAKTYYWALSFVYDGYQESALQKYAIFANAVAYQCYFASISSDRASNYSSVNLKIHINVGASALSKRITGINLYRAESFGIVPIFDTDVTTPPASQYRFVKSFSIRNGSMSPEVVQSAGSATAQTSVSFLYNALGGYHSYALNSGTVYRIEYADTGFEGGTYEENTGISDTLEQNWINYKLSTFINGYHFVGQCAGLPATDTTNFIFRSLANSPSVFNVAANFLQLSETPTALVSWNSRLFAFSETTFWRINPEGLFIEEELRGFGALGDSTDQAKIGLSRLISVTPYGIFFADLNNVYLYDGRQIRNIGDPITRQSYAGNLAWVGSDTTRRRQSTMVFDPYSQRLLIFYKSHDGSDDRQYYLSYDPVRDRWDYGKPAGTQWSLDASVKAADFDSTGKLYVSLSGSDWGAADVLHTMFTGDDEDITVVTAAYDFGSLKQTKWFYDVVVKNAGPLGTGIDIDYRTEETASWTSPSVTTSGVLSSIDLNKTLGRVLQIRATIAGQSGNGRNSIDDMSIQFRRKVMRE